MTTTTNTMMSTAEIEKIATFIDEYAANGYKENAVIEALTDLRNASPDTRYGEYANHILELVPVVDKQGIMGAYRGAVDRGLGQIDGMFAAVTANTAAHPGYVLFED